jgi:hypothetical protein
LPRDVAHLHRAQVAVASLDFLVVRLGRFVRIRQRGFLEPGVGQKLVDRRFLPPQLRQRVGDRRALGLQVERPFRAIRLHGLLGETLHGNGLATATDLLDLEAQDRGGENQRNGEDDGADH